MDGLTTDVVEAMYQEAKKGADQALTDAEVAFVEGAGAWRVCPVDGTRYFHASKAYPVGRKPGTRFCSGTCEAQARAAAEVRRGKLAALPPRRSDPFVPDVDGTLGSQAERESGGPVFVGEQRVHRPSPPFNVRLGEPVTAWPSDGGSYTE